MTDRIRVDESKGTAECPCGVSVTVPPTFGGIPRANLLAAFVIEHSVHDGKGRPDGLTPTGRASKAARTFLTGGSDE